MEGVPGRFDCDRLKEKIFEDIDYFRQEYQLTYAEVVGVLEIVKLVMVKESGAIDD